MTRQSWTKPDTIYKILEAKRIYPFSDKGTAEYHRLLKLKKMDLLRLYLELKGVSKL